MSRPAPARRLLVAVALVLAGAGLLWLLTFGNPSALWWAVSFCRDEARPRGPCTVNAKAQGFVIVRDLTPWRDDYLLVPVKRVSGIESPLVFEPPLVDFWQAGWNQARRLIDMPPERIGLAINSAPGRSQNQLHIHLSCLHREVAEALARAHVGERWAPAPFLRLAEQNYNVMRTSSLTGANSPFRLAAQLPGGTAAMANRTLAVAGMPGGHAFYVLADSAGGRDPGTAEDLLDERCR